MTPRLSFLLALLLPLAGTGQQICRVYQCPAGNDSARKLVLVRSFDVDGRIIQEQVHGYTQYLENTNTMYSHREDGKYEYYYYNDSLCYKVVHTELDDVSKRPVDSGKLFYYYDDAGRLVRETDVKHLKKREVGKKPGSIRNATTYVYDAKGRVKEKTGAAGIGSGEYYTYDDKGRLLTDSVHANGKGPGFFMVSRYEYTYDGYREYAWACDRSFPIITVVRQDGKGRVTEQATWFHIDDEAKGSRSSRGPLAWGKFLHNDMRQYKQYERTQTQYDAMGRVTSTKYYFGGKHTTTHLFEYE